MRALTIRQPWASLVAVGAKRIETRGWPTKYRGPLLIHAGNATPETFRAEDGDVGEIHGGDDLLFQWFQPWIEDRGDMRREDYERWELFDCRADRGRAESWVMPLGAVVASCRLVDCVPIVESPCGTNVRRPDHVCTSGDDALLHRSEGTVPDDETETVYEGERPFGDFSAGRFAWLLEDVKPTTEPIPCRGKQGLWVPPLEVLERVA